MGGMSKVLTAMREVGARRICFTDSIGSFGAEAPRSGATARWLTENPTQDPGSDYGRQKRGCRELMAEFASAAGGDPRFAVLPGVLHSEAIWGNGTTEYALDALLAASKGEQYECPVEPDVTLPMIFVDDLMRGLLALQDAEESALHEPENGYAMPGLSFSAEELFEEIRRHVPDFVPTTKLDDNMAKFARLWPDTLSTTEPLRDLGYAPQVAVPKMVETCLEAHAYRKMRAEAFFRAIDADRNGLLDKTEISHFMVTHLIKGREERGWLIQREDLVEEMASKVITEMDLNGDSLVSSEELFEWCRRNTFNGLVEQFVQERA